MTLRTTLSGVLGLTLLLAAAPTTAAPLAPAIAGPSAPVAGTSTHAIDYRPYYHCHGPKRCHGKGNYYKYSPSDAPIVHRCQYGRGCGYNTGWNSPSSYYAYTGRRWHRHHRRRHR